MIVTRSAVGPIGDTNVTPVLPIEEMLVLAPSGVDGFALRTCVAWLPTRTPAPTAWLLFAISFRRCFGFASVGLARRARERAHGAIEVVVLVLSPRSGFAARRGVALLGRLALLDWRPLIGHVRAFVLVVAEIIVAVVIVFPLVALITLVAFARPAVVLLVLGLPLLVPCAHLGDDAVIVVGVLHVVLCLYAVALLLRVTGQVGIFFKELHRIAALARFHAVTHFAATALRGARIVATSATAARLRVSHANALFPRILPAEPTVDFLDKRTKRTGPKRPPNDSAYR